MVVRVSRWAVMFLLLGCQPASADTGDPGPERPHAAEARPGARSDAHPEARACRGEPGGWHFCGERCLCGEGQGDCDSDEDCGAGLYCTRNLGAHAGWRRGVDLCLPRCPGVGVGGWEFCSEECPCYQGEGDCDGDEQCMRGLVCARDRGHLFSWDEEIDVCLRPQDRDAVTAGWSPVIDQRNEQPWPR